MGTIHQGMLADMDPDEQALLSGEPVKPDATAVAADDDGDEQITGNVAGDETADDAGAEAAATEVEKEPADEKQEAAPSADEAAAALAEMTPEPTAPPAPKAFEVPADDFDAKRKVLQAERKDIIKQWGDGELSDEQYAIKLDELDGKIYEVIQQQAKQQTLAEINEQNKREAAARHEQNKREAAARQQAAETAAMQAIAKASKDGGLIDYGSNVAACTQFDALHNAAKLDPANANLSAVQVAQKAHDALLALRGLSAKPKQEAAAPAASATPTKPKPAAPPTTLGMMPAAAANATGDSFDETFDAIEDPDEREAKWASLSAAQRQQQLRRTVPTTRGRH